MQATYNLLCRYRVIATTWLPVNAKFSLESVTIFPGITYLKSLSRRVLISWINPFNVWCSALLASAVEPRTRCPKTLLSIFLKEVAIFSINVIRLSFGSLIASLRLSLKGYILHQKTWYSWWSTVALRFLQKYQCHSFLIVHRLTTRCTFCFWKLLGKSVW